MTKPRSYAPSTGTHRIPRPSTRKRIKKAQWKNSATYSYVRDKARAIQAGLGPRYPSFIKILHSSYATGDILSLPLHFRRKHLRHDDVITLVVEDGIRSPVVYLSNLGLRGGWKDFCAAYNLQVGDALVCQLVSKHDLKVYSVRVKDVDHHAQEQSGTSLLYSASFFCSPFFPGLMVENNIEIEKRDGEGVSHEMKNQVPTVTSDLDENLLENDELGNEGFIFESDQDNCSYIEKKDALAEKIAAKCSSPEPFVDLKNFRVVVNGFPVDSGLSVSARVKYYELCLARKSNLHGELLKRINHQLATGIILETVSIADAIKACCHSTSQSDIKEWETKLEGFRLLGMDVGFLLDRVKELLRLAVEYQESGEAKRYYETTKKEKQLNEELASLERKMMELKDARATLQSESEVLEAHILKQRLTFQETAKMPW